MTGVCEINGEDFEETDEYLDEKKIAVSENCEVLSEVKENVVDHEKEKNGIIGSDKENGEDEDNIGNKTNNDEENNQVNDKNKEDQIHDNVNDDQKDEKLPDDSFVKPSKLSMKKKRILAKYGIDPSKKLPRKPSVYGNFVDIAKVNDGSERKHIDPWLREALGSPPKKKISPTKIRTGIKGISRSEWLKTRGKRMEQLKFEPIKKAEAWLNQHNAEKEEDEEEEEDEKEEDETIPVGKLSSDDENESGVAKEKIEEKKDDEEVESSAIYLDPDVDFMAYCRQEEEEREKKNIFEASQLKDVNESELDMLITQGAVFDIPADRKRKIDDEDSCGEFKKMKIIENEGNLSKVEEEDNKNNEDEDDIIENVPKKKVGKLNFEDDEDVDEIEDDLDEELEDEEEIEGEEAEEVDDEEIDENNEEALLALQYKRERENKMKRSEFYDDEASLSGDDVGTDDEEEDGSDLDDYEIMDGDYDEVGNQKELVNNLAKQQMLQELKADERRLRKIKEKLNIYDEDDPEQLAMIYRYQTRFMAEDVDVEVLEKDSDTEDHLEVVELPTEDSNTILSRKAAEKAEDDEWEKEIELGKKLMEKNRAAQMVQRKGASNSIRDAIGLDVFFSKLNKNGQKKKL